MLPYTRDSKGQGLKVGDFVRINKEYGGGSGEVIEVMNGFIVVQLRNGQKKSYNAGSVTKTLMRQ
jgi:hypothetical protein